MYCEQVNEALIADINNITYHSFNSATNCQLSTTKGTNMFLTLKIAGFITSCNKLIIHLEKEKK